MKLQRYIPALVGVMLAPGLDCDSSAQEEPSNEEKVWKKFFDCKSMSGWRSYMKKEVPISSEVRNGSP